MSKLFSTGINTKEGVFRLAKNILIEESLTYERLGYIYPTFFFVNDKEMEYDVVTSKKFISMDMLGSARNFAIHRGFHSIIMIVKLTSDDNTELLEQTILLKDGTKYINTVPIRNGKINIADVKYSKGITNKQESW